MLATWAAELVGLLVLLEATPVAQRPVYPSQGNGFAAGLFGGFFALGLIVFALIVLGRRPPTQRSE